MKMIKIQLEDVARI